VLDITEIPSLPKARLAHLLDLRAAASQAKAEAEATITGLNERITKILKDANVEAVRVGRWQPMFITSHSSKLDKTKLIELGCKPSWLAKATTDTPYTYFTVVDTERNKGGRGQ
jgi:hypothetical protein